MDAEQFGKQVAARRKELGMTQAMLGDKLHLTAKTISKWECGHGFPDISSIIPLAEALHLSIAELMMVDEQFNKEDTQNEIIQESIKNTVILAEKEVTKKLKFESIVLIGITVILLILIVGLFIPTQEHVSKSFSGIYHDKTRNESSIELIIDMRIKHYLLRKDTVSGSLWIVSENDRNTCLETQFMERIYHPEDAYFLHVDYYNSDNNRFEGFAVVLTDDLRKILLQTTLDDGTEIYVTASDDQDYSDEKVYQTLIQYIKP